MNLRRSCCLRIGLVLFLSSSFALPQVMRADEPRAQLTPQSPEKGPALEFEFDALRIGVGEYAEGPTGVTVFHFPKRVTAVVDVRGGAPSASGTDVLRLGYENAFVDAIVIAGGSSYGLEAADGVRAELLNSGKNGTSFYTVATIPAAIVYDFVGRETAVYPDKELGRAALRAARAGRFPLGARGAGRHVTVGKYFGPKYLETAGQGGAFRQVGPTKIAVFTVVNAVGSIVGRDGQVVRGNRDPGTGKRTHVGDDLNQGAAERKKEDRRDFLKGRAAGPIRENTTITLVVINQKASYWALQRLAVQVHTSMARAIQPFHTQNDGDVLFAVTTSEVENPALEPMDLSAIASELAWDAVLNSVPK